MTNIPTKKAYNTCADIIQDISKLCDDTTFSRFTKDQIIEMYRISIESQKADALSKIYELMNKTNDTLSHGLTNISNSLDVLRNNLT